MPRSPRIRLSRFAGEPMGARPRSFAFWLAGPGLAALVIEPAVWLGRSWLDPSYQSDGWIVAAITAALLLASFASGSAPPDRRDRRRALVALAATAGVRLIGRLLAVHTIGALALVVDVWAVAVLVGVRRRPFALQPVGLALFFALALPVEHLAQRLLGHPLQRAAATTSEWVLAPFFPELTREGVLLVHPDAMLAVDLPCSGARGLVLLTALALGLWTCRAPGVRGTIAGSAAVVLGAFAANTLRIIALFIGGVVHVPVIEEPWHSAMGALVLAIGAAPLLLIAMRAPARRPTRPPLSAGLGSGAPSGHHRSMPWPLALAVSLIGLGIAFAPERPLDVSGPVEPRRLPTTLGRFVGLEVPLREREAIYYTRFGGYAQKRIYDDGGGDAITALLVRTRSPLRHLHGPEACLTGAGHDVTRLGVVPGATPAVVYRSIDAQGRPWRIEASFVSDRGEVATSVSEVVWRWLEYPDAAWSLVERITPWSTCERTPGRCRELETALFASLDLPVERRP